MNFIISIKNKIKNLIRRFTSEAFLQRLKNSIRPVLLKLGLMPNILKSECDYYIKWAPVFVEYINRNPGAVSALINGLDDKSVEEVNSFISRVEYINNNEILLRKKLFSKRDVSEQISSLKNICSLSSEYKKFKYFDYYPSETFYGLNGAYWLPEKQQKYINEGAILDVGACYGDSAIALFYNLNSKNIYCFEPENDNFSKLKENLAIIGEPGIKGVNYGISDKICKAKISNDTYTSVVGDEGEEINITTIDNFIFSNNIGRVSFIKFDIEGGEQAALIGAQQVIKRDWPILSIAIYHNPVDFFNIKLWLENNFPEYKLEIKKTNPFDPMVEVVILAYR